MCCQVQHWLSSQIDQAPVKSSDGYAMLKNMRSWKIATALAVWSLLIGEVHAMKDVNEMRPPSVPASDETQIKPDPSFEAECMAALADTANQNNWQFKNSLLTRSEKWGLVWRVDFVTPVGTRPGAGNRATCWRLPEQAEGELGLSIDFKQGRQPLR
jgi:hypothetical protein